MAQTDHTTVKPTNFIVQLEFAITILVFTLEYEGTLRFTGHLTKGSRIKGNNQGNKKVLPGNRNYKEKY